MNKIFDYLIFYCTGSFYKLILNNEWKSLMKTIGQKLNKKFYIKTFKVLTKEHTK